MKDNIDKSRDKTNLIYNCIKKYAEEGRVPSVREICKITGIPSTSTVYRYIERLVADNVIEKYGDKGKHRGIRLIGQGQRISVPILGTVTGGAPISAVENIAGYIQFTPKNNKSSDNIFALTVRGDSMRDIGIVDKGLVVVEQVYTANNGDVIIAMIDEEEYTCKRFFEEEDCIRLMPENSDFEPMIYENHRVQIIGKVIAAINYM